MVRSGGWIFAAAIPRFIRHAVLSLAEEVPHPHPADWISVLEHGTAARGGRFPDAYFHTAEELEEELGQAGLTDIRVCAIEGPDGLALEHLVKADEDLQILVGTEAEIRH